MTNSLKPAMLNSQARMVNLKLLMRIEILNLEKNLKFQMKPALFVPRKFQSMNQNSFKMYRSTQPVKSASFKILVTANYPPFL